MKKSNKSVLERSPLSAEEWRAIARDEDVSPEALSAAQGMMAMSGDDEVVLMLADAMDEITTFERREIELLDAASDEYNSVIISLKRELYGLRDFVRVVDRALAEVGKAREDAQKYMVQERAQTSGAGCHSRIEQIRRTLNGLAHPQEISRTAKPEKSKDGCRCQSCGAQFLIDVMIQDDLWERIKPNSKPEGSGLLCGSCIFSRLASLDEFASMKLSAQTGEVE